MPAPLRAVGGPVLAALLLVRPAVAQQVDSWWGADKLLHFSLSAALAGFAYGGVSLTHPDRSCRLLWGGTVAVGAGMGKEVYDLSGRGDPSWRDMTWNAIGVAAGLGVALLIDVALKRPTPATSTMQ
ncbi:MAG: hypothetical protein RMJ98_18105 [Myxococcales bacterium]|nr:hypothetical protein [Polyangiaceae bacterium]MDW8251212.1 hypothetical protein [Myxococcales bacterium]